MSQTKPEQLDDVVCGKSEKKRSLCPDKCPEQNCWFFRDLHTLHHPDAPAFFGTFAETWGCFFSGFPHTTLCRCSGFSWDIYPDTGVVPFRFSGHYIMQILRVFLGHLPGHCGLFFWGFCTSYRCSGNSGFSWAIYPDRGCYSWVVHTLHHADAPDFLGTFTCTPGLFFWGFPHGTETCTPFLPACDIFV